MIHGSPYELHEVWKYRAGKNKRDIDNFAGAQYFQFYFFQLFNIRHNIEQYSLNREVSLILENFRILYKIRILR